MEKKFIGIYHEESHLLRKVEELKAEGHDEKDITVVGRDEQSFGHTDVKTTDESWMDRMKAKFTKESPLRETLKRVGHSEDEAERHYKEIEQGGLALFVNKKGDHLHTRASRSEDHGKKVESPGVNAYENHDTIDKSDRAKWDADQLPEDGESAKRSDRAKWDADELER
ncbi:general stress protein [Exiguobacterium flavidum]|uniref:general stress protein n=1 Tax=Exiguobacterium flavidum TaxID=2184695 RepID=UPI001E5B0380|nr:general stress protein [Exiguobacterium flavidum]